MDVLESDQVDAAATYFDDPALSQYTGLLGDLMPTITDSDPGNTATGGGIAVVVDAGITVVDGDGGVDDLTGAAVRITGGLQTGEDELAFNSALATGFGISGAYDASTGELILSGAATADEYQQVLRTVTYRNTNATPDTTARDILFVIGDDFDDPAGYAYCAANGHYYQLVSGTDTWTNADTAAAASTLGGLQGYLGTITSAAENTTVAGLIGGGQQAWLAASDNATEGLVEGEWTWVRGPEAGTQFWAGDFGGAAVGGMYTNWEAGQPDDTANSDYMTMLSTGTWTDEVKNDDHEYVVEYGGLGTDVQGQLVASVAVNVANPTNNGPVLDNTGDMSLTAIDEDDTTSAGDTVAAIIASAGGDRITDADGGALEGIAVTAIDNTNGTWQYSTDGGTNWTNIGAAADNNALLLRDTDLVRFQPDADWNGTVARRNYLPRLGSDRGSRGRLRRHLRQRRQHTLQHRHGDRRADGDGRKRRPRTRQHG